MKKKVLYIGQFPPPVHGVSYINKVIKNSELINKKLDIIYYDYRFTNDISTIGKLKFKSIVYLLKNISSVFKILRKEKREIIFTIVPVGIAFYRDFLLIYIIRIFYNLNFKLYLHAGNIDSFINKNRINKYLYQYLSGFSNFIFLRKGLFQSVNIKNIKYTILNNFYPKIKYISNDKNQSLQKKSKFINFLFLSNYVEEKGVLIALEIFKKISSKNKNIRCYIVGSDNDLTKNDLLKQLDLKQENQIKILGPLYGKDKYDLMKKCEYFIFPSMYRREAFPVVMLEAVACKCLVLSSAINGINEIFKSEKIENDYKSILSFLLKKINFYLNDMESFEKERTRQHKLLKTNYSLESFEKNFINIFIK